MGSKKLLLMLKKGGKSWIEKNALLYDTFKTDDAAPITSPRTCEPGPGALTAIDTTNKLSISGDQLVASGTNTNYDPSVNGGAVAAKTSGSSAFASIVNQSQSSDMQFGYVDNVDTASLMSSGRQVMLARYNDDMYVIHPDNTSLKINDTFPAASYISGVVLRDNGAFYIVDGELVWVDDNTWPTNLSIALGAVEDSHAIDFLMELPLADYNSAWGGDWSEVTDTKTNPASDTTFDCAADCHFNKTVTVEDTNAVRIRVRYTDGDNYFELFLDTDRTVRLRNTVGGSIETLHTTAALTDATSYEFDLILNGSAYSLFIDKVLADSGSVTNAGNNLITGGIITHNLDTNDIVLTTHPYPALGIADSRVVRPQEGDTATHSADCVIEFKNIQLGSGASQWRLRNAGGSNYVLLTIDSDGDIDVWDWTGPTRLINCSAGTVSNGDDIVVVLDGTGVEVFVSGASIGSSSSLPSSTATTATFYLSSDSVYDHIACFPRDVSSLLPKGTF